MAALKKYHWVERIDHVHHTELVAHEVGHAYAVRAAGVGTTGPECQQTLDLGVEG